jgi:hypothetical protein
MFIRRVLISRSNNQHCNFKCRASVTAKHSENHHSLHKALFQPSQLIWMRKTTFQQISCPITYPWLQDLKRLQHRPPQLHQGWVLELIFEETCCWEQSYEEVRTKSFWVALLVFCLNHLKIQIYKQMPISVFKMEKNYLFYKFQQFKTPFSKNWNFGHILKQCPS